MHDHARRVLRAAAAPIAVLGLHLVLRLHSSALVQWPPLNRATHLAGGLAIAHLAAALVEPVAEACAARVRPLVRAAGIFALTTTTAVAWEFYECVMARVRGIRGPSDPGDTLQDIAVGMAGAAAYATWRWAHEPRGECRAA